MLKCSELKEGMRFFCDSIAWQTEIEKETVVKYKIEIVVEL